MDFDEPFLSLLAGAVSFWFGLCIFVFLCVVTVVSTAESRESTGKTACVWCTTWDPYTICLCVALDLP